MIFEEKQNNCGANCIKCARYAQTFQQQGHPQTLATAHYQQSD